MCLKSQRHPFTDIVRFTFNSVFIKDYKIWDIDSFYPYYHDNVLVHC